MWKGEWGNLKIGTGICGGSGRGRGRGGEEDRYLYWGGGGEDITKKDRQVDG